MGKSWKQYQPELSKEYFEAKKTQCPKCFILGAMEIVEENDFWWRWKCRMCGFERKHTKSFAIYEMRNGKTFLKRNGWLTFKEVELKRTQKGLQVVSKLSQNSFNFT